jgi:hypothetical protein
VAAAGAYSRMTAMHGVTRGDGVAADTILSGLDVSVSEAAMNDVVEVNATAKAVALCGMLVVGDEV